MTPALMNLPQTGLGTPLQADARTQVPLLGFSGAKVLLLRDLSGQPFVRKIAGSPAQNGRLREQALKQQRLKEFFGPLVQVPEVLADATADGVYFYDMAYLRGLDGISFLRRASFESVRSFTGQLSTVLEALAEAREPGSATFEPAEAVRTKCAEIIASLHRLDPEASNTVERLVQALASWKPVPLPPSLHHGDMTLENIVVLKGDKLGLIDGLETYFSHWLADVAKLEQDLRAGWYLRHHPPLALGVVHFVRRELAAVTRRIGGVDAVAMLPVLIAANLARILPYAKTDQDRRFVAGRLTQFIDWIEKGHG